MVNVGVEDNRVGAKNTEVDGLTIRGNELLVRGYEFSSGLIHQGHEGRIRAPPTQGAKPPTPFSCKRSLPLYSSLQSIIVLHLLVIHAYT